MKRNGPASHNGRHKLTPPQDLGTEKALLGSVMMEPERVAYVRGLVDPLDFYLEPHQRVCQAIYQLHDSGKTADSVSVLGFLENRDSLGDGLPWEYLKELVESVPHGCHAVHYAGKVKERAVRRTLIMRVTDFLGAAQDESVETNDLLTQADGLTANLTRDDADRITVHQLQEQHPRLHPPIIEGLVRVGETANVISVSKSGKSWLAYGLALSVVTGRPWLDKFATTAGKVLLIDNELHKATLASRIKTVAEAMAIPQGQYADQLEVWSLRGKPKDIFEIGRALEKIAPTTFKMVILDAKYRAIPLDASENDNAAEARFYNEVDRVAERLQASIVLIHHASKGEQSGKRVTDVGAGAGAQSRAADCHIVLREHEEPGAAVLEAAVRSFPPVAPMVLRWAFPLWMPDAELDPEQLKGKLRPAQEEQRRRDAETDDAILSEAQTWRSRNELSKRTGFGDGRLNRGVRRLVKAGLLEESNETRRGNPCEVFRKTIQAR